MRSERYYYNTLSRSGREAYDAMRQGFSSLSASIRTPVPESIGLGEILFLLKLDDPEIFFVKGCSWRRTAGAEHCELIPEYMFDRQRIREHRKAIDARLEKLLRPAAGLSPEEKEKYVHDFICRSVRYDKLEKSYSHEIIGPLQNGVGVCEGIAKTVQLMCTRLGLECMIAVSVADPEMPGGYMHAWNIVTIGGRQYHLDATFDATLSRGGEIRYDYYNLDDTHIFRDHRPLRYPAPECTDGDKAYYRTAKMSLTREEDCARRVIQAIKRKKPEFVFHWRGGYLTRQKLLEINGPIEQAARSLGRGLSYSVNWPQAVVKLTFTEPGQTSIKTDNAEEEERS